MAPTFLLLKIPPQEVGASCLYSLYRPEYPCEHPNALETRLHYALVQDEEDDHDFFEQELIPTGHFLDRYRFCRQRSQKLHLSELGQVMRVEEEREFKLSPFYRYRFTAQAAIDHREKHRKSSRYDVSKDLPLCVAVCTGDWPRVKELVAAGADCMEESVYGNTAFKEAILKEPDLSFLKYFIEEQSKSAQKIIDHGAVFFRSSVEFAALNNCIESMKLLLGTRAPSDANTKHTSSCLSNILEYNDVSLRAVKLLLESGASQVPFYLSALSTALTYGLPKKIIKLLLRYGADPSYCGDWMIFSGLEEESLEYLELFLEAGIDINQVEPQAGETALIRTVFLQKPLIFKKLLSLEAKIDVEDFSGATPLYHAIIGKNPLFFEELVACGADINYNNCWGSTPLMIAARNGLTHYVRRLVELGADLELKDQWGATALIAAARPGYREVIEYLLAQGADHAARNIEGETAYSYAKLYGHFELANLLEAHHRVHSPAAFKVGEEIWATNPYSGGEVRIDEIHIDRLGCHYLYTVSRVNEKPKRTRSGWEYPRTFKVLEYALAPAD